MQWPLTLLALALPFVVASGIAPRTQAIPTGIVSLVGLRDNARPLLIFAPKPDDPQLEIQLRRTQQNATVLAERDVVVIAIPYNSPSTTPAMLTDADTQTARRRFNIAPADFAIILLGKDGGEKLRFSKPLAIDKLCQTIDAMRCARRRCAPSHPPDRPRARFPATVARCLPAVISQRNALSPSRPIRSEPLQQPCV
jgi:hypothetical protein